MVFFLPNYLHVAPMVAPFPIMLTEISNHLPPSTWCLQMCPWLASHAEASSRCWPGTHPPHIFFGIEWHLSVSLKLTTRPLPCYMPAWSDWESPSIQKAIFYPRLATHWCFNATVLPAALLFSKVRAILARRSSCIFLLACSGHVGQRREACLSKSNQDALSP